MANVLIADDEEEIRSLLKRILTELGHIVREAADGNSLLRLYEELTPDLIILDLVMPDKEGIETIIELRQLNPTVKIIAMSASAYNLKIAKIMGADHVLEKPFAQEAITALVKEVFS